MLLLRSGLQTFLFPPGSCFLAAAAVCIVNLGLVIRHFATLVFAGVAAVPAVRLDAIAVFSVLFSLLLFALLVVSVCFVTCHCFVSFCRL